MSRAPHRAAFSFDVEDWFHSELHHVADARPEESIVVRGTSAILDLCARHRALSTFFVLGDVVREHPELIRRIVADGHELACHGMSHRTVWRATPESFRQELRAFRAVVTEVLGSFPVTGFRAPTFSIDRRNAWALDVLADEGYRYDSSVFPMKVKMYGTPGAPLGPYRPSRADLRQHDPAGRLVEFPVALASWAGLRLPVAGGFYLRALPSPVFEAGLASVLAHRPAALYLHPREVTPESRRLALDPVNAFITYVNLDTVVGKLDRLFAQHRWTTMHALLVEEGWLAR